MEFTKSEKRRLRELAGEAYEAEAHALLEELDAEFARWRKGEILSSELLTAIHEFHRHQSRELWSMYQGVGDATAIERGISLGFIPESQVPSALLAKLRPKS